MLVPGLILSHYGPSIETKFPTSFTTSKNVLLIFSSCITFDETSESVDGLQIRVNLANPKIADSIVIQYLKAIQVDFEKWYLKIRKKFQNIIFHSKVIAIWNIYQYKNVWENTHRICSRPAWKILMDSQICQFLQTFSENDIIMT